MTLELESDNLCIKKLTNKQNLTDTASKSKRIKKKKKILVKTRRNKFNILSNRLDRSKNKNLIQCL